MKNNEIYFELTDTQWPLEYINHDREIARAIVFDDDGYLYFVKVDRDDDFGKAILIETSGGGVEKNEDPAECIIRELKEELGANVIIITKLGIVSDYYNLIHRHNINNYFLCKLVSFQQKHLTQQEINNLHLSTLKLKYPQALQYYQNCSNNRLGNLIASREIPILNHAQQLIVEYQKHEKS